MTDVTADIAAEIAATPTGGELRLSGQLPISNGFTITQPINIVGDGDATCFTGTLPAGVDLFRIAIPAGATQRDYSFCKMQFQCTGARSWFNFDTTAAANTYLQGLLVEDILAPVSPTMHAVWANGLATGAGLSQADFNRNKFTVDGPAPNSVYMLQNVGDTIHINAGIQTGTAYGLWLLQVAGAGGFSYREASCTSLGGLVVQNAIKPIFADFELELSNFDLLRLATNSGFASSGAGIYLLGCDGATIGPGQAQAIAGCQNFNEMIYCGRTSSVDIDMRLTSTVGGNGIVRSASAFNTTISPNTTFAGFVNNIV